MTRMDYVWGSGLGPTAISFRALPGVDACGTPFTPGEVDAKAVSHLRGVSAGALERTELPWGNESIEISIYIYTHISYSYTLRLSYLQQSVNKHITIFLNKASHPTIII